MLHDAVLPMIREGYFDIFDSGMGLYSLSRQGLFGYTTGRTWNGWACPLFPRESVERIQDAAYWAERTRHNPEEDSYSFYLEDREDWETFQPQTIVVPGEAEVKVWGIGHCLWTWEVG